MTSSGVILAAGRGTRLAPVTDHTPKPLVPFFGVPTIDVAVCHLIAAGVTRIAINAHHLAEAVASYVQGPLTDRFPAVSFHISVESELLGTGGALVQLEPWLREDPQGFWLANSDAVHTADLRAMEAAHEASGADTTLLVTTTGSADVVRNVAVDDRGRFLGLVTADGAPNRVAYCGLLRAQPGLLAALPHPATESCVIRQGLLPWIADGAQVDTWATETFCADLGTPERYLEAHRVGLAHLSALESIGLFAPKMP